MHFCRSDVEVRTGEGLQKRAKIQFSEVMKHAGPGICVTVSNEEIKLTTLKCPTGTKRFDCSTGAWNSPEFSAPSGHTLCLDVGELLDVVFYWRELF